MPREMIVVILCATRGPVSEKTPPARRSLFGDMEFGDLSRICTAFGLIRKFGREESFEGIQVDRLELAETLHPDRCRPHRVRVELAPLYAASFFLLDQTGAAEDGQMLGDRGKRHIERFGDVRNSHIVFEQHGQDRPAGRISQSSKNTVEGVRRSRHGLVLLPITTPIVNQLVEYCEIDRGGQSIACGAMSLCSKIKNNLIKTVSYVVHAKALGRVDS